MSDCFQGQGPVPLPFFPTTILPLSLKVTAMSTFPVSPIAVVASAVSSVALPPKSTNVAHSDDGMGS